MQQPSGRGRAAHQPAGRRVGHNIRSTTTARASPLSHRISLFSPLHLVRRLAPGRSTCRPADGIALLLLSSSFPDQTMASFAVLALAASTVAFARPFEGPALTLAEKRNNDKHNEVAHSDGGHDFYTQMYSQYGAKDMTNECVVPHTDGQDDTPNLIATYDSCGHENSKIVFAANTTYNIVRLSSFHSSPSRNR